MNRNEYYEILITLSESRDSVEDKKNNTIINDVSRTIIEFYYQIKTLSVEKIDDQIINADDELQEILFIELKYVKGYQILAERYSNLFTPIKHNRKKKLENDISKIENNRDIKDILDLGAELIKSPAKPLYVGICLSLIYDRMNRVEEAIRMIYKIIEWYPESKIIKTYLRKLLQEIYFRNRVYDQYNKLLKENSNWVMIYLYKFVEFSHFHYYKLLFIYLFVFSVLWFLIGRTILFCLALLVIINIINVLACILKKNLLLFTAYMLKIFTILYMFGLSTIVYFCFR